MHESTECALIYSIKRRSLSMTWIVAAAPFFIGILGPPASHAQSQQASQSLTATEPNKPEAAKSIHQLFLEDQAETPAGKPGGVSSVTGNEFEEHGEARRLQARAMLAKGDIKTGRDFYDASLLFQHGNNPDDYLLAHVLAVEAVIKGYNRSKWMAATTLDRYLQSISKPQIFGTQYPLDPNILPVPAADPHVARFKGRTQSPFNDQLLPATIRRDFCVPDLAQQKQNLATLNSGKYPGSAMILQGCQR